MNGMDAAVSDLPKNNGSVWRALLTHALCFEDMNLNT
jgi:hypothetical protein